ncbi:hypothetical protein [Amycolatopsis sp. cmx-4-83]|uniref:hypothetical protein n=1 Tax=Amycolatopsis sp. cmx-4-83 TaxID=2790940 RepID=UPI00397C1FEA
MKARQLATGTAVTTTLAAILLGNAVSANAAPASLQRYSCVQGGQLYLFPGNDYIGTPCTAGTSANTTICFTIPNTTCSGRATYVSASSSNDFVRRPLLCGRPLTEVRTVEVGDSASLDSSARRRSPHLDSRC